MLGISDPNDFLHTKCLPHPIQRRFCSLYGFDFPHSQNGALGVIKSRRELCKFGAIISDLSLSELFANSIGNSHGIPTVAAMGVTRLVWRTHRGVTSVVGRGIALVTAASGHHRPRE